MSLLSLNYCLVCDSCKSSFKPSVVLLKCPLCNGLLDISSSSDLSTSMGLPFSGVKEFITLGEGSTPLTEFLNIANSLGLMRLFAKLEFLQPTGSFKDRGSAVMISVAKEEGITSIVEDSSGNAGASIAAYAAAANIEAHIFVPSSASKGKIEQIKIFGANLHIIEGTRELTEKAADSFAENNPQVTRLSHSLSPFFIEGMKSAAHEIANTVDIKSPIHIVLPIGNGGLTLGLSRGFADIKYKYNLTHLPIIHCVQSSSVPPITSKLMHSIWECKTISKTVATGIAVAVPPRIDQVVNAVRSSGGSAVVVQDSEILYWQKRIAREQGIFCEPTSATAFAGLEKLLISRAVPRNSRVLIPVTGNGLKESINV